MLKRNSLEHSSRIKPNFFTVLVNIFDEFSHIICAINKKACSNAIPRICLLVHLQEIASHHVHSSNRRCLNRTYVWESNRLHLICALRIIDGLMHPRIDGVLTFDNTSIQNEIRSNQHEQGEFVTLAIVTTASKFIG